MLVVMNSARVEVPHRLIPLVGGGFAIVDPEDFDWLSKMCWRKKRSSSGYYAVSRKQHRRVTHTVFMHRLIMKTPYWMKTHHINHNRLDNRKANLMVLSERMHRHFDGWHYFEANGKSHVPQTGNG
ncbi:hypothetical protein LCGC14_1124790 [marine sediment metagenome]|uniref:HNH nuclease domain-containing protein n=1 Tax=marine sediment metagenome TaxID=412755 RepID=A0A0F9M2X6_9ZZZZ